MARQKGSKRSLVERRAFLQKGALAGAVAIVRSVGGVAAQTAPAPQGTPPTATTPVLTHETESAEPTSVQVLGDNQRSGSDYMVDVLKSLGFDYICANPGSSFRGIHESVINYGGNQRPELITCCHEESSVAMGHGYAKVEGKPLGVFAHGTVGLQHAAMAIYNAWCDRR